MVNAKKKDTTWARVRTSKNRVVMWIYPSTARVTYESGLECSVNPLKRMIIIVRLLYYQNDNRVHSRRSSARLAIVHAERRYYYISYVYPSLAYSQAISNRNGQISVRIPIQ